MVDVCMAGPYYINLILCQKRLDVLLQRGCNPLVAISRSSVRVIHIPVACNGGFVMTFMW
jgi:hypothetical protein